jgi:hypothetical protein
MGLRAVGDLVTDTRRKHEAAAVSELCFKFTVKAKQEVSLFAPVVSEVARRVFNHPNAYGAKLLRSP